MNHFFQTVLKIFSEIFKFKFITAKQRFIIIGFKYLINVPYGILWHMVISNYTQKLDTRTARKYLNL